MKLKNYIIEVRDPVLGYWETIRTVEPHWKITEHIIEHHFLFWSWLTLRVKFQDSKRSRDKCRETAMRQAFELYRGPAEDIRVRRTQEYNDGTTYTYTVWENGVWEDC